MCTEKFPLNSSQMSIYLQIANNPQTLLDNLPRIIRFDKTKFNAEKLRDAVQKILLNHESFSCCIDMSEEEPKMKVISVEWKVLIERITENELDTKLNAFIQPFDYENGPLARAVIFETEKEAIIALDFSHLIFDGTSQCILNQELKKLLTGENIEPEILSFTESLKLENSIDLSENKAFFDKKLGGVEVNSNLVNDFSDDVEIAKFSAQQLEKTIAIDLSQIKEKFGVSRAVFFTAAYAYTLAKFNGSDESLFCTINHGRTTDNLKNTTGMFARTLPLYTKFNENECVVNFLQTFKLNLYETIKHGVYPFANLANDFGISADMIMVYQGESFSYVNVDGESYDIERLSIDSAISKVLLMIYKNSDESYRLSFIYRKDLYAESLISAYAEMYVQVLREFLKKEKLFDIQLLSEEQKKLQRKFNQTEFEYDTNKTLVDLWNDQVQKLPNKTAVVYEGKEFTFKQVDCIANKIAGYLQSQNIGSGDVVSVIINRSEWMSIASIGVLKTGAAYQPLDPTYPSDRLEFMVNDAEAALLIADEDLLNLLPNYKGKVLLTKDIATLPDAVVSAKILPADRYIMLYTSGSTGVPKGCQLMHKNIVSYCLWAHKFYELSEESVEAVYASYGFDASMFSMYPALTSGATICIVPEDIRLDLEALKIFYEKNGVTNVLMTTQIARLFLTTYPECGKLKYLSLGGEALVPIDPTHNKYKIYNVYGPTECTITVTTYHVTGMQLRHPIGSPNGNVHLYVCDKQMRQLPVGALGELCIAGVQVAQGYLNRPEKTAEVFIQNPFEKEGEYARMYKTGDIVRWLPDGNIDFIGRRDGQVKVRGFRIELSEVEKIVRDFPSVKNATVVAFDDPAGGKAVAAYLVGDEKIDTNALADFILEQKPPYMVPAAFIQIDEIPLNVNGKVDKRKLPPIDASQMEQTDVAVNQSLDILDEKLMAIIESIIGHKPRSTESNLMREGLTSLSVIKLAVAVKRAFGLELNVRDMKKNCSVHSIKNQLIEFLLGKDGTMAEKSTVSRSYQKSYPLSSQQFGVYADTMHNPLAMTYNTPISFHFAKMVDAKKLAAAVKKVMEAHPYSATYLTMSGSDVEQIFVDKIEVEVPIFTVTEAEKVKMIESFIQPFNLTQPPLYRIEIIKTEKEVCLIVDFHHIVFDGYTADLFIHQVAKAYKGEEIKAEEFSYFDYMEEAEKREQSAAYREAETYFDNLLKMCEGASDLVPDLEGKGQIGHAANISMPTDLSMAKKFCSENDITPAHLYFAASAYVVARFVGTRDVFLNTISNGRSDMRLTDTFGMFVNTLPIVANIDDMSVLDFVKKISATYNDVIEHEIYPYAKICQKFDYAPNILFEYQMDIIDKIELENEEVALNILNLDTPKMKCRIIIEEEKGIPSVKIEYNDALYSKNLMQTFAESIEQVMRNMVACPSQNIRNVSMLTAEQKAKIDQFCSTEKGEYNFHLLHEMFKAQAAKTPEHTAVVGIDRRLTYSELDKLSNIVANELMARGLQKQDRVAVFIKRDSRLFTTILGIMKAGATVIPVASDYPKERIEYIIKDSEARFIIADPEWMNEYDNSLDVNILEKGTNTVCPQVELNSMDLAYMLYTSGSTGTPKGVMLPHDGFCNYFHKTKSNVLVEAVTNHGHIYGSVTSITFDIGVHEHMMSLCHGLTLVFADDDMTKDVVKLTAFMSKENIDVFSGTQSRILQYMELPEFEQMMSKCTVIIAGGEPYPTKLLNLLREKTQAELFNFYAPTECTIAAFAINLRNRDIISVGYPMYNRNAYIVDMDNNRLPIGVIGELIIAGTGVTRGYNNLPERTAAAYGNVKENAEGTQLQITPMQFNGEMRCYRSGDYARWSEQGEVVLLGRKDNQVKLRGLRIELDEIISRLSEIEGMKTATAFIRKLGSADAIVAYYVADRPLETSYVKAELSRNLVKYMIPSSFNQLDSMPLTPNGKINFKALPEPIVEDRQEGRAPKNDTERILCEIFSQVLSLDTVYADDNFFDLGGSSLTVTRVIIGAQKAGIQLVYADVFAHPSPEDLAKAIGKILDEKAENPDDIANYNYDAINHLLESNTISAIAPISELQKNEFGDVLLLGATGFLGIHILHQLLEKETSKIYCFVRPKNGASGKKRLQALLMYYFDTIYAPLFGNRLFVIEGDIDSLDKSQIPDVQTIINCAAVVKHFAKEGEISRVNQQGAEKLIDIALEKKALFVQTSTNSVAGSGDGSHNLSENELYFGQILDNQYTGSKFLAERAILEAVATRGLRAKIMRLGNLMPRQSDGEFQINFATNNFMNCLRAYAILGCIDVDSLLNPAEFAPIDQTASAILALAKTPDAYTVFHPYNHHNIYMSDVVAELNAMDIKIDIVENETFQTALQEAFNHPEKATLLTPLMAYAKHNDMKFNYSTTDFTIAMLNRLGFRWAITENSYLKNVIEKLKGMGYFGL